MPRGGYRKGAGKKKVYLIERKQIRVPTVLIPAIKELIDKWLDNKRKINKETKND